LAPFNLSLYPIPSHWYQPPNNTCFTFLVSILEKKTFLFVYDSLEFPCDISMYVCIITQIDSCPPSVFLLSTLVPFLWLFQQV
jgi:hypothetical protein